METLFEYVNMKLIYNNFPAFGGDTKGDLIAELKLSHTIGGVSKLRSEQVKIQYIFKIANISC